MFITLLTLCLIGDVANDQCEQNSYRDKVESIKLVEVKQKFFSLILPTGAAYCEEPAKSSRGTTK